MLFKAVLIVLELGEFDKVCHAFGIPVLTKSSFGKNRSYKVLTPDDMSFSRFFICQNCWPKFKLISYKC